MAATNTQVGIFTRIPHRIRKSWSTRFVSIAGEKIEDIPSQYVHSPVSCITVDIEFGATATTDTRVFNEADDQSDDRMSFVRQQRQLYDSLESNIQSLVDQYTRELTQVARTKGIPIVEVPTRRSTQVFVAKEQTSTEEDRSSFRDYRESNPHHYSPPSSAATRVRTIAPSDIVSINDSASQRDDNISAINDGLNMHEIARTVAAMAEAELRGRTKDSNRRRRRSLSKGTIRARSILSKATGSIRNRA